MRIVFVVLLSLSFSFTFSQNFKFESIAENKVTPVKSQGQTGTCWAFSTISFLESEIMRMGGPELDLSEMYIVKHVYERKAKQYVYLHGMGNFSQGGQAHDVLNEVHDFGLVPEYAFSGKKDSTLAHNHYEMEASLKNLLHNYINQKNASPSQLWFENINSILLNYLGELPNEVNYKKRSYSPSEFAKGWGVEKAKYIELSSYTHHPFYSQFDLEVPDNWSHDRYYNLPVDELIEVMKTALNNGFTLVWDGDVSEDFFSHSKGLAIVPLDTAKGFVPQEEKQVTQDERQNAFFSWKATDDHLMHIVGLAKDQNGTIYFKTKNSWGTESNPYGGYVYMSEQYLRMNTVAIMLSKDALSKEVSKKIFK